MYMNNFKDKYKIHMSEIEESYQHQLGLKNDLEYEKWAEENIVQITQYLTKRYPTVKIKEPQARIKSDKSLLGKVKNLQIERLSKLSAIKGLSIEQEEELYQLIKERVYEKSQENPEQILRTIEMIIKTKNVNLIDMNQVGEEIASIDDYINAGIEQAEETIMRGSLSESTKTALLRVLIGKIENSNVSQKDTILKKLYKIFGREEDDLIRYESIDAIKKSPKKLEELEDSHRFLKAKDLMGMEIIIEEVPDTFESQNDKIKEWIEKRKESKGGKYEEYDYLICTEIGKEMVKELVLGEDIVKKKQKRIIEDSVKHKKKNNGYEADHMKFESLKEPEYTFELQIKSKYVEKLAKKGSAAHDKRPGKNRDLPNVEERDFVQELKRILPRYKVLERKGEKYEIKTYTIMENCRKFFENKISEDSEWYKRAERRIEEENIKEVV